MQNVLAQILLSREKFCEAKFICIFPNVSNFGAANVTNK